MNQTSFPNANLTAALQFSHSLSFRPTRYGAPLSLVVELTR